MKLDNSNQTELTSQGMMSPLPSTKFLLDTVLSIIHARTSSNILLAKLEQIEEALPQKTMSTTIKMLASTKTCEKTERWGEKKHITPCTQIHCLAGAENQLQDACDHHPMHR
jgi:hypothetical protein